MIQENKEKFGAEDSLESQADFGPEAFGAEKNSGITPEAERPAGEHNPGNIAPTEQDLPAIAGENAPLVNSEQPVPSAESILENSATEPESEADKLIHQYVREDREIETDGDDALNVLNDLLANTQNPGKK